MQALTYSEPTRTLALQAERPLPVPGDAEVLIRVLRAGICSTVSNAMTGRVGHTPAWYICCCSPVVPCPAPSLMHICTTTCTYVHKQYRKRHDYVPPIIYCVHPFPMQNTTIYAIALVLHLAIVPCLTGLGNMQRLRAWLQRRVRSRVCGAGGVRGKQWQTRPSWQASCW